jgi:hypothetical protein
MTSDTLIRVSMTLPGNLIARLDDAAPSSPYRTRSALAAHLLARAFEIQTSAPFVVAVPAAVVAGCIAADRGDTAETVVAGCGSLDGVPTTNSNEMPGGSAASRVAAGEGLIEPSRRGAGGSKVAGVDASGNLAAGINPSRQDASMDTPAQPRVSDLARQNAAQARADAATKAAQDAAHQSDLDYIRNLGKQ